MKTLADVRKALTLGASVEITGVATWVTVPRVGFRIGDKRNVTKVQSGGVWLSIPDTEGNGSFLSFGKASEWTVEGDTFTHEDGRAYTLV